MSEPEELRREESQYRRALVVGRLVVGAFAVLVLALLVAVVYLALQVRHTQLEGTPTGKKLLAAANQIESCTTPDGECYKRGQKQQGGAIADINKITVYAAACADREGEQTVEAIQFCVLRRLAADDRTTP